MNKRRVSLALAVALLSGSLAAAPVFAEAGPSKEKTETIVSCGAGYIAGFPDGTFRPEKPVTRAEVASMIAKLKNLPMTDNRELSFAYVGGWYNVPVNAVIKAGYMKGYSNGAFEPNEPMMRGEFVKVLSEFLSDKKATAPFTDTADSWAKEAIEKVYANGIIKGYEDNTFRPTSDVTRAEAVVLLNRTFAIKKAEGGKNPFTDISPSHWAYEDILAGTGNR